MYAAQSAVRFGWQRSTEITGVIHCNDGNRQEDIWGADWYPVIQQVSFEALIHIKPRQGNRSMLIAGPAIRERASQIVQLLLGGV